MDALGIPDAVGPVVGWRAWRIGEGGSDGMPMRLQSIAFPCEWPLGAVFTARCLQAHTTHEVRAPQKRCRCGIYAVYSPRLVFASLHHTEYQVVGEVYLWGRTVVAKRGWRAERAYPKRLCVLDGEARDTAAAVAGLEAYGVRVEVMGRDELAHQPPTAAEPPGVWRRFCRWMLG
jgi:hypothetical protein